MTTPQPRTALESIPSYQPGKPPSAASGPAHKLSSNENPYPPLPGVVDAAQRAVSTLNRYPDMGVSALHQAIADRYGMGIGNIASGAGSVAVLYHLLQAMCAEGDEVVYAWRSFEAYPIAVGLTGATSVRVPLTAQARHDLDAMAAAVTDATKVVVVCTPNNPTGPVVTRDELEAFVERVPPRVVVAVDEAYQEFVTDPAAVSGVDLVLTRPNVVVLRTFSKAYGLAGLRVGFALAPEPIADAIRKCSLPFGVSHVAQETAIASLAAEDELLDRVDAVVAERERVADALAAQGWDIPEAQGNFVWLPLGEATAAFAAACDAAGVAVRPFAGEGCRVTIGEPAANDTLLGVAADFGPR